MQSKSSTDRKPLQRVIKKYPNRRLYDTDTSSYITLAEIKQLVMESEPCVVRDAKTGEDLTRSILLQIILEEEANGTPMFTVEVLANIIRFYGHAMQGLMGGYLEKNMQALIQMQAPLVQGAMSNNLFQQMQEQMQKQTEQLLGTFGLKR
jgi:polyhydroxyalkanoate synthesis repressor PhaR